MKVMSESVFNSIIEFIDEYYFANNTVPTMQEIADAINLNKSNVSRNLQVMKERGLIETTGGWRGIRTKKMSKVLADTVRVPIVGSIAEDGDFVIVRQQSTAEEGQIVVALIDDEATLKRFYLDKKKHRVRLHPENDKMEDMFFDSIDIQGVVVKVIKDVV